MLYISCHKQLVFRNLLMAALRSDKCSGLLPGRAPRAPEGEERLCAACLWNLAVRLALRLALEFEHTSASYSKQVLTYYGVDASQIVVLATNLDIKGCSSIVL